MTVNQLIEQLQQRASEGYGDHQVVCDYPLASREDWGTGIDWTTVEDARFRVVKFNRTGATKDVVYLDWRR